MMHRSISAYAVYNGLAEFAARRRRINLIIFPATCASEKFFSAASVPEGRAQPAANPIGNEIEDFMPATFIPQAASPS